LFGGNLREKDSFVAAVDHQQTIAADANVLEVQDVVKGSEDGDFVLQYREFGCVHGRKTRITESGESGGISNGEKEWFFGRGQADASAQLTFFGEGDEGAALLLKCGEIRGGRLVHFLFADGCLDGFLRQLDQGVFLF